MKVKEIEKSRAKTDIIGHGNSGKNKRVARAECETPTLNSLAPDLCQLTEPNAATVLDALKRRYLQNVIH
ncbi:hypothetical protein ANCDUO_25987, partial [Ancylostoma duodenale]